MQAFLREGRGHYNMYEDLQRVMHGLDSLGKNRRSSCESAAEGKEILQGGLLDRYGD
jgi:hypothetical protein